MGFIHNLFWRDHDAEITGLKSDLGIMSNNYQESLSKNAAQLLENEGLRDGLVQVQKSFSDHMVKCSEAAENAEKLVGTPTDQALQAAEIAGDSDKALIYAVVITAFVCTAIFIALCAYLGNRAEQNREEKQNFPETGMSSSRASSVSDLVALDRV